MVARAASAAATGERILDAAVELFWEAPGDDLSLDEVARRAGVTVQTVIRRFGGKDGLFAAAAEREAEPADDLGGAVRVLADHYEALGDRVIRLLAEAERDPRIGEIADRGRRYHREWCERVFATSLVGLRGLERRRRLGQLVAVCDVYVWKLLRRDGGLSRPQTELALVELLAPVLEGS
jgi:AcrR family transcriptional regulator